MTAPSGTLNILKANWFAKHRQQRPAVAVVFFDRRVTPCSKPCCASHHVP